MDRPPYAVSIRVAQLQRLAGVRLPASSSVSNSPNTWAGLPRLISSMTTTNLAAGSFFAALMASMKTPSASVSLPHQ